MRAKFPLVCPKHGATHLVVREMKPGSDEHSHAECGHVQNGRQCGHWKPLQEKQVKYLLKKYPYCQTVDYKPHPAELVFDIDD